MNITSRTQLYAVLFSGTIFFIMWPFSQTADAAETGESPFVQIERECEQAEKEFNETFKALADHDAERVRLVLAQERAAERRNLLWRKRAEQMRVDGKIR